LNDGIEIQEQPSIQGFRVSGNIKQCINLFPSPSLFDNQILTILFTCFHLQRCSSVKTKPSRITSETVEKVLKQILGEEAEKNDLTEYATINDLTMMRGHETPKTTH